MTEDLEWECVCGETDPEKHTFAEAIAHIYEVPQEEADQIVDRMLSRLDS